jgi:hypothetical protein
MAKPINDWFLRDWAKMLGKRQVDFVRDLGWNKSKANLVWHNAQAYNRETINEVSQYLQIAPYELLLHPDDAMAIRQLRISARQIARVQLAAEPAVEWAAEQPIDIAEIKGRWRK